MLGSQPWRLDLRVAVGLDKPQLSHRKLSFPVTGCPDFLLECLYSHLRKGDVLKDSPGFVTPGVQARASNRGKYRV